jgi:hypothetical protein
MHLVRNPCLPEVKMLFKGLVVIIKNKFFFRPAPLSCASSPYIFCNSKGNLYNFRASFIRALENVKISSFEFHDPRHTMASYLAISSGDLDTIRDILGHESLGMALRYAHLSKSHQMVAVSLPDRQKDIFWTNRVAEAKGEEYVKAVSSLTPVGSKNFGAVAKW